MNDKTENKSMKIAIYILVAAILVLNAFNQYNIVQTAEMVKKVSVTGRVIGQTASITSETLNSVDVTPKGAANIYGNELGISYNDVSLTDQQKADATIRKLAIKDTQITLQGKDLERYINITSRMSCEYCCGVEAIIFPDGRPACGCAHSYAMRGLTKYLIKNHPSEYTNDQILEELGKWKTLFFPDIMAKKAYVLKEKGIELNYINLASNKYRGIESGAGSGSMAGGC